MKIGGVNRTLDKLGRVVLPMSMRKALGIQVGDDLDVTMEGERIILQKCRNGCVFCDSTERLVLFNGRKVCGACVESLSAMK
jgi:transcriptional pleiotropic regulator of transition state genes